MRVVADTGPLVAAANEQDEAHALAAMVVDELGRDLVIPFPVIAEVDYLLRTRVDPRAARQFLQIVSDGGHRVAYLSPELFRRAVEIDMKYADLGLGITDTSVMAYAESRHVAILTFDFGHFRATRPRRGFWKLLIDETRYRTSTRT